MAISRRNLRKGLVVVGCLFGHTALASSAPGLVLILLGAGLHWLSKAYLEQNRALTTAGPYRWSRNPFYIANLLIDAGILWVIGQVWIAVVYLPLWALAYSATIRVEEERLREIFGSRFDEYAAAVPRFFRFQRPLHASRARGRFDLRNPSLMQGREYARLLGIALAPASIFAAESIRSLGLGILEPGHGLALGVVLSVPALWIFKLGLAETFRRPEVSLLPAADAGLVRVVWVWIVLLPLVWVGGASGAIDLGLAALNGVASLNGLAAVGLLGAATLLSLSRVRRGRRIGGEGLLAVYALVLGYVSEELWLAILPALWFSLAALDEAGRWRVAPSGARERNGSLWRYFPRIAGGAVVGLMIIGSARLFGF